MTEYRQDDRTDEGYCPKCGERVTTVFVDGGGWCADHGRVWCDWTRPRTTYAQRYRNLRESNIGHKLAHEIASQLDDKGSDAA